MTTPSKGIHKQGARQEEKRHERFSEYEYRAAEEPFIEDMIEAIHSLSLSDLIILHDSLKNPLTPRTGLSWLDLPKA